MLPRLFTIQHYKTAYGKPCLFFHNFGAYLTVLKVDIYAVGTKFNYKGNKHDLVACCCMTTFAIAEPTHEQNAEAFALAIMNIWTCFGFSHTIVVDKDSKFRSVFEETAKLLGVNMHVLSGENHDPMLTEHVNRFPNASLTIFCNE